MDDVRKAHDACNIEYEEYDHSVGQYNQNLAMMTFRMMMVLSAPSVGQAKQLPCEECPACGAHLVDNLVISD